MADSKMGDLIARVVVIGHASPRWNSASSSEEANRLNQRLSDARAQNVRTAVDDILKTELGNLKVWVDSKGVVSHDRAQGPFADNWAVDRSVEIRVELTTIAQRYLHIPPRPTRIYVPSKIWPLKVVSIVKGAALGYVQMHLRIVLQNPYSGKEITLSGWLSGGGAATSLKQSFDMSKAKPTLKPIGREVVFSTPEAMGFDDFNDQWVRLGKVELAVGLRTMMTYLVFPDIKTTPDMLIFDHKSFGVGFLKATAFLAVGKLSIEGKNPGDWFEVPANADMIPIPDTRNNIDVLVLTFPTQKANLSDLTDKDRKLLRDYVTSKARAIVALSDSFNMASAQP